MNKEKAIEQTEEKAEAGKPKKKNPGFEAMIKPGVPSTQLAAIIGSSEPLTRGAALKAVWQYVRDHNLQNHNDKRIINCDAKMEEVFQRKAIESKMLYSLTSYHVKNKTSREVSPDELYRRFKDAGDKYKDRLDALVNNVKVSIDKKKTNDKSDGMER